MMGSVATLKSHLVSAVSLCAITLNLVLASIPLGLAVLTRALATGERARRMANLAVDRIYRGAAAFDSWWITRVLGVRLRVINGEQIAATRQCIVLSNHRTWFDILVIQAVVTQPGPIVHFLIKEELIYVPVVGWICMMLGFPRLTRGKDTAGRDQDFGAIETASASIRNESAALLNFAEGTRFSPEKRKRLDSKFKHLLNPRTGGMRIMMETLPDVPVLDLTLVYPGHSKTFWSCLSGHVHEIEVHVGYANTAEIKDVRAWLYERWAEKDRLIEDSPLSATI
jgi:1-acyl-sn-glycerol-3-phosphate acyltransferase